MYTFSLPWVKWCIKYLNTEQNYFIEFSLDFDKHCFLLLFSRSFALIANLKLINPIRLNRGALGSRFNLNNDEPPGNTKGTQGTKVFKKKSLLQGCIYLIRNGKT